LRVLAACLAARERLGSTGRPVNFEMIGFLGDAVGLTAIMNLSMILFWF
jgi:hypothetical protein